MSGGSLNLTDRHATFENFVVSEGNIFNDEEINAIKAEITRIGRPLTCAEARQVVRAMPNAPLMDDIPDRINRVCRMVADGAEFLQNMNQNPPIMNGRTRQENMTNLVWLLTARSFCTNTGRPMDEGMYTLGIDNNPATTQRLFNYFTRPTTWLGKAWQVVRTAVTWPVSALINYVSPIPAIVNWIQAARGKETINFARGLSTFVQTAVFGTVSGVINVGVKFLNLFPGVNIPNFSFFSGYMRDRIAYPRSSSHFPDQTQFDTLNLARHYGLDMADRNRNSDPGANRNADRFGSLPNGFTTTLFGQLNDGRLYLKPEHASMDPTSHPGEVIRHSADFALGARAVPNDGNYRAFKEKYVHEQEVLDEYSRLMGIAPPITRAQADQQKLTIAKMQRNITNSDAPNAGPAGAGNFTAFCNARYRAEDNHASVPRQYGGENAMTFNNADLAALRDPVTVRGLQSRPLAVSLTVPHANPLHPPVILAPPPAIHHVAPIVPLMGLHPHPGLQQQAVPAHNAAPLPPPPPVDNDNRHEGNRI